MLRAEKKVIWAVSVGKLNRRERSGRSNNTSDKRHDTSDVASIIAKSGVFAGLPLLALSLILPLPTAADCVWSVQPLYCGAQRKLVGPLPPIGGRTIMPTEI